MKPMLGAQSPFTQKLGGLSRQSPEPRGMHVKRGHPKTLLDDDQVRECRRLSEEEGKQAHVIARQFGTSTDYMRRLLSYELRSKVMPIPSR
jgi:hypothetical protein